MSVVNNAKTLSSAGSRANSAGRTAAAKATTLIAGTDRTPTKPSQSRAASRLNAQRAAIASKIKERRAARVTAEVKKRAATKKSPGSAPSLPLSATPNQTGFLCCLRYVHIGKAGGTSVEAWVTQGRLQGLQIGGPEERPLSGAERAITFHHPFEWFSCRRSWETPCVRGTSLRDPVERFRSSVYFARDHGAAMCGFVRVDFGTELADCFCHLDRGLHTKHKHRRDAALARVLDHPEVLRRNSNRQTAYLGLSLEDLPSAPVHRCMRRPGELDSGRRHELVKGKCVPIAPTAARDEGACRTFEGGVRQIWRECASGVPNTCAFALISDPQLAFQGGGPQAEAAGRAMLDRATARLWQLDFVAITSTLDADMEGYFPGRWGRHHDNKAQRSAGTKSKSSTFAIKDLDTGDTARGEEIVRRLNWLDVELVRRARTIRDAKLRRGALTMAPVTLDGAQWTLPGAPPLRCLAPQWEGRPTATEIEGGTIPSNRSLHWGF